MILDPDAVEEDGRWASRSPDPVSPVLFVRVRDSVETVYEGPVYLDRPVELPGGMELSLAGVRYWSAFDTVCGRGLGALFLSAWVAVGGLCIRFLPQRTARGKS